MEQSYQILISINQLEHVNGNSVTYFDSFGVENVPKEFIGSKSIITNIYRIQAYDLVTCVYFCTAFIDFMCKGKCLANSTNLISLSNINAFAQTMVVNDLVKENLIMVLQYRLFHKIITLDIQVISQRKNESQNYKFTLLKVTNCESQSLQNFNC